MVIKINKGTDPKIRKGFINNKFSFLFRQLLILYKRGVPNKRDSTVFRILKKIFFVWNNQRLQSHYCEFINNLKFKNMIKLKLVKFKIYLPIK